MSYIENEKFIWFGTLLEIRKERVIKIQSKAGNKIISNDERRLIMRHIIEGTNESTPAYSHSDGSLSLKRDFVWNFDSLIQKEKSYGQALLATLKLWKERVTFRRELARINDRLLDDIGLTRAVIERETDKWFWQA